jgi:hypothetical protein
MYRASSITEYVPTPGCPNQESNLDTSFRKAVLCPLSYRGFAVDALTRLTSTRLAHLSRSLNLVPSCSVLGVEPRPTDPEGCAAPPLSFTGLGQGLY